MSINQRKSLLSRIAPGITLWMVGIALSIVAFVIERRTGWRRGADPTTDDAAVPSVYFAKGEPDATSTTVF